MSRNTHIPKTPEEKGYYSRYIKKQDYEQTVDQGIHFPDSDIPEKDFDLDRKRTLRKKSVKEQIDEHFEDNWLKWVLAGIALIISIFIFNFKVNILHNETNIEILKDDVTSVEEKVEENSEKLYHHDKQIEINKIRIDDIKEEKSNMTNEK